MSGPLNLLLAERRGSKVAQEFGFHEFPINPALIAEKKRIAISGKPLTGCCGCLIRRGDNFGIVYSTELANQGMVNFTIAHELGHYFLEGHPDALFADGVEVHQSAGPFRSTDPREREADHFAVGLLLPEAMFVKALRKSGEGIAAVMALAQSCGTSLTATAIRFATLADDPVAVVVATAGKMDFCFLSAPLRDHKGLKWPRKGDPVPTGTVTSRLAADSAKVAKAAQLEGGSVFSDWIDGAPEVDCQEEVIGLGRFGQTLTVLWTDESLEDYEDGADDD